MSALQFQRQLDLSRYETAFTLLQWLSKSASQARVIAVGNWRCLSASKHLSRRISPRCSRIARCRLTLARESSAAVDQIGLRREAALRGVVTIGKMPKEHLGRRVEPALLDRPVGREVAHGAAATILRRAKSRISLGEALGLADALRQGRSARPCNAMILFSKPLVGREGLPSTQHKQRLR